MDDADEDFDCDGVTNANEMNPTVANSDHHDGTDSTDDSDGDGIDNGTEQDLDDEGENEDPMDDDADENGEVDGDDVLAWALERNGRCDEGLHYSQLALRLGTQDSAKLFHRAMIERCLGHPAAARRWLARSRATNPYWRRP